MIQIFDDRGHSISLCYRARLVGTPGKRIVNEGDDVTAGDLRWFKALPSNLYPSHFVYNEILEALNAGLLGVWSRNDVVRVDLEG